MRDATGRGSDPALPGDDLFLRRLAEKLPAAAYVCDADGLIRFYNEQAARLWGRSPRLEDPDDRYCGSFALYASDGSLMSRENSPLARALREGRDVHGEELAIGRPDGSRVYALAHASPIRDGADRIVGCANVLIDVSARRRAEERLESSELRFERFMHHLPGLAWIKDLEGCYVFANDAAERAFQRRREELYGCRDDEIFPPATSTAFRENDREALLSGKGLETIETLEHADGVHHSFVSKFPIPGPDGAPRWIAGIAIDVTARMAAEAALRETEARFRDMADHAPVLIWVNDRDGCSFVNREYLRFLGCSLEEVRGDGWRRFVHPADVDAYVGEYARSVSAQRPFEALLRFRRADGAYRWLRSTGVPRVHGDGALIGYVGCSVDITEMQRTQEALREADRRKDEFLATLAHELRNPLAPMRSALETLRDSGAPHRELHRMLERQLNQLVRLVDDLLDVSRITRGHIALRRESVTLGDVLRTAVETAQPQIEAAQHALVITLPSAPLRLEADPLRLSQLFVNLLSNAAKYTPDGGRIEVAAERRGDEVVVAFRDDGIGIPPDVLPRIFEPFTQLDRAPGHAQSGLGIGLALVAQLAALHGGRVEARSDGPGCGSEFRVTLPLAEPRTSVDRAPLEEAPEGGARSRGALREPILVVDDNRDAAESLASLLRSRGLRTEVALDGPSALRAARALAPAVVLLDLGMPEMDGFEVARRLRADPACRGIVLVALTGWNQAAVSASCAQAGFDHHLVKPVKLETLQRLLLTTPGKAAG